MHRRTLTALLAAAPLLRLTMTDDAQAATPTDPENTLYMDLKDGRVVIELLPQLAPKAVERVKILARRGFYDNTPFHRVIDGFMAQTGDPTGTGGGGSKLPDLKAEFSKEPFVRGTIGMARTSDPNSANSQFFICFGDASFLNGQYTVVGKVIAGMDVVDKIKKGSAASNGSVSNPDKILTFRLANDPSGTPVTPIKAK